MPKRGTRRRANAAARPFTAIVTKKLTQTETTFAILFLDEPHATADESCRQRSVVHRQARSFDGRCL
jgi:hypothetical protein